MTPHTDWRMPQGRGDLSGCGAHDQTVGQCAGEANPATQRGSTGGTDTSSASGRAARPRSADGLRTGVRGPLTAAERDELRCRIDVAQRRRRDADRRAGKVPPSVSGAPSKGTAEHVPLLRPRPTGDPMRQEA